MSDHPDELAELRAVARRAGVDADHRLEPLAPPPADLLSRIEAELATDAEAAPPATVVPLRARRSPARWAVPLAAAAAVAVIAGIVVAGDDDPAEPEVLATVALDPLGDAGSGTAELVDVDGTLQLRVDTADLDPGDGFLELWVIDTAVERLVSLGPIRADGTYDLPPGLDPADFPIVDVSVEPIDGDPTHSGDSVLRGQLPF